ncbi:TonB-dependent receptor [Altericroceibacterium spongiae]|uniref:TonB-dependent receptor n=1 Tax=Altericroceibacterium spongiae TaxID=2320269 RepID=A0A420EC75_9SPHN|nr:TonB-dependent receptor [Altericroceibacterium spongiae]RKF18290.1 TonB-dependent receptor [Altericroceibacterium spongiae]
MRRLTATTVLLCGASVLPSMVQAATAADSIDNLAPNDNTIIVTAQKIEQREIDVPITISATSGEQMKELGVTDLDELSNYVPGLNIQEQSANNPGIVIRGITSDSGSSQQAARVTLYYNGVDISRSRGAYQGIYDMERIEVIKGPQATLFGTASTVGAVSLVSAKPREGFSGELSGSYGNYDATTLSGFLNAGNDVLAGRVAFEWQKRDGYVNNLSETQDDLYAKDQLGIRGSLRFTPNDDVTADLIVTYDRQRNSGTPFISGTFPTATGRANPFGDANLSGSPLSQQVLGNDELGLHRDVYDVNLTVSAALDDNWTMSMVNGYRDFDAREVFDADGSAAWFLEFAEQAKGWQINHETRFTYDSDILRASLGWNLFHEDSSTRVPFSSEEGTFVGCARNMLLGLVPAAQRPAIEAMLPDLACVASDGSVPASQMTPLLTGAFLGTPIQQLPYQAFFENQGRNSSYSVFADATYLPMPALELTAGARVLYEKRNSGYVASAPASVLLSAMGMPLPLIPSLGDTAGSTFGDEDGYWAVLPRFNALYHITPDVNVYATISKGRRSPTVSVSATSSGTPVFDEVPAEIVWNYEGGIKLATQRVSASFGVYYQKYDNFQVSRIIDGRSITESAGSAGNFGVEAELSVRPTEWLNLFGNLGYIDGGIDNKEENGVYAGDHFRLQPEWQWAAGFTVNAPLGNGMRFFATPSVTYRSKIYFEVPNSELISQDAVTLVNARAGVSFAEDRFELAAFGRNITNKDYLLDAGNTGGSFGVPTFIPAEPRFYGVELTARF